jgi:hypothetical protein
MDAAHNLTDGTARDVAGRPIAMPEMTHPIEVRACRIT